MTARRLQSIALADTCEAIAITRLLTSPDYRGGDTVRIGEHSCAIGIVTVNEQAGAVALPVTTAVAGVTHAETATALFTHIELGTPSHNIGNTPMIETQRVQYDER